jgi:pyridoxal phosphate enzyme (YggS family)
VLNLDVDLAGNLQRVHDDIAEAALSAGRSPSEVTLIGVSKTQPVELLAELVRAGLRHVGENRVQEAAEKFPRLPSLLSGTEQPVRHMIGHLQSNKAGQALELFDRVDSVDSVKLAQALSRRAASRGEVLPVLVEVYVGDDSARPGVRPPRVVDLVGEIVELPRLRLEGLMTVAPLGGSARDAFATVRNLKLTLSQAFPAVHFGVLSMGMSGDFREAILEGATEVRIGTALFGPRRARF